jgi:hypothetical protein
MKLNFIADSHFDDEKSTQEIKDKITEAIRNSFNGFIGGDTMREVKPIKMHWHHCPECYEQYQCMMECTIEPDLEHDGKQYGAHCKCFQCEPLSGRDSVGNKIEEFSQEWWDKYNGIIRCG